MRRSEMIERMVPLYRSIPDGASDYHKMDILLGFLIRNGFKKMPDQIRFPSGSLKLVQDIMDQFVILEDD